MTGQDFQDKLDAIVLDLQTSFPNHSVQISLRGAGNVITVFSLSSVAGVVNGAQLGAIQDVLDDLKPIADSYTTERVPVTSALETFKTERAGNQVAIDAASAARIALSTALLADADYQTAKTALDTARAGATYVTALTAYQSNNVSENFGNLSEARGNYFV
jgi:hypothetical protein